MVMTALAVLGAFAAALCLGYHLGRCAGSTRSSRRRRTTRVAIGGRALGLLVVMAERRVRRRLRLARWAPDALGRAMPTAYEVLRGGLARARSY